MTYCFLLWIALVSRASYSLFRLLRRFLEQPWARLNDPNSEAGLAALAASSPDLLISLRYGRILQPPAISLPSRGVLNLHSGRLPQYRGVMATFRAMLAGDTLLGTTLHWIDDGSIDTGRIVNTHSETLDPQRCYLSNVLSLYKPGCGAIIDAIHTLSADKDLNSHQAKGLGITSAFLTPQTVRPSGLPAAVWADLANFLRLILQRYHPPARELPSSSACLRSTFPKAGLLTLYRATLQP